MNILIPVVVLSEMHCPLSSRLLIFTVRNGKVLHRNAELVLQCVFFHLNSQWCCKLK